MNETDRLSFKQDYRRGEPLAASDVQGIARSVAKLLGTSVGPRQRTQYEITPGVAQFRYQSSIGDYWVCREYDGINEGTLNILIAKPFLLRRSLTSYNGITYTYVNDFERTANDGANTETQVIVPAIVTGALIYASRSLRGTNVVSQPPATPIEWLDINADARAFAKKFGT